jgi:thioredoxin reductase
MNAQLKSVNKEKSFFAWQRREIAIEAGNESDLHIDQSAIIIARSGAVVAHHCGKQYFMEQGSMLVIDSSGEIRLTARESTIVAMWDIPSSAATIQPGDTYVCNLEILAAAAKLLGDVVEVTSLGDHIIGVHHSRDTIQSKWKYWISLDGFLWLPEEAEINGFKLVVQMSRATSSSELVDIAIIGAGPAGLSAAAYAVQNGLEARTFGEPMAFWKRAIVPLPLRSQPASTNIDTPAAGLTYAEFVQKKALGELPYIPFYAFLAYSQYFINQHDLNFQRSTVTDVSRAGEYWLVKTDKSECLARNIIVAVGLKGMERVPEAVAKWGGPYTCASEIQSFAPLMGKSAAIVGAGQSAVEIAIEAARVPGAAIHLLVRGAEITYRSIHSPGSIVYKLLFKKVDKVFHWLPLALQDMLLKFLLKGTAEPSMEEKVRQSTIRTHMNGDIVEAADGCEKPVKLWLRNGLSFEVDHLILGTGYSYDVRKLPFLKQLVKNGVLRHSGGFPLLSRSSESSARGIYFAGMSALRLIGPQCQFVFGTKKVTPRIMASVLKKLGGRHA